ncbi:hypothetical protein EV184_12949 [Sinorhizobium americanum]|uniref:Uncharacterized protein n=1 Tax=Sinorhizobium americanum TaxID=194963 RepID=A0A4V2RC78_9HYPH|nr:hypothetical protein EV184_12949 [Sinorhizobium americanum]
MVTTLRPRTFDRGIAECAKLALNSEIGAATFATDFLCKAEHVRIASSGRRAEEEAQLPSQVEAMSIAPLQGNAARSGKADLYCAAAGIVRLCVPAKVARRACSDMSFASNWIIVCHIAFSAGFLSPSISTVAS